MDFILSVFGSPDRKPNHAEPTNEDNVMPENKDKFEFLFKLTEESKQCGKTSYQHMVNVYMALKEQNLSEEVCDAGLFHSIYGAEFSTLRKRGDINRDLILHIIGEYAEELVHIFCTSKNRFDTFVHNKLNLTNQQVIDLCYIENANLSDHNEKGRFDQKIDILDETIMQLQNEKIRNSSGENNNDGGDNMADLGAS